MYSPPLAANALETLAPSKVEQLRAPPSSSRRLLALMWWMAVQGAQENLLSFITWWTFWHGIVHGMYQSLLLTQCTTRGIYIETMLPAPPRPEAAARRTSLDHRRLHTLGAHYEAQA